MQPEHLKSGTQSIEVSCGWRNPKIHPVAASDRIALAFRLSAGQCHDTPQGRLLLDDSRLNDVAKQGTVFMAMDRGYEDDQTRKRESDRVFITVVPPKSNRKEPCEYDRERYKRRNEIERLFRCLKRFRRVCTGYEKLDVMYLAVLTFALTVDELILC